MKLLTNEEIEEMRRAFSRFGSNAAMNRLDVLIAERTALAQQLADARETIRRWGRLTEGTTEFDFTEGVVVYVAADDKWQVELVDDGFDQDQLFDSPIEALAAIERWEAEQKGGDA